MTTKPLFLANRMDSKLAVVFILIGLLPLVIAGSLALVYANRILSGQVMGKLQVVADGKAERIEHFLRSRVEDVTVQARGRSVLNLTEQLSSSFRESGVLSPGYATAAKETRERFIRYAQPEYYDNVLLIAPNGDVVFSVFPTAELGTNLRTAPHDDTPLANVFDNVGMLLSAGISNYETDPAKGVQHAFVAAPIFKNGVLTGVLALRINNRPLFEIAENYTGLGDTGETIIGRREGDSILVMAPTRHDPAAAFQRRMTIGSRNGIPLEEATRGNNGIGQHQDYRGVDVLAAWQYLPSLRCGLVVKMDTVEAFAPVRTLSRAAITLGVLIALLVALLAPLAGRYLAAPIRDLAETKRAFSAGDLSRRARVHSNDEIGKLAAVFNQMADTIQQQIAAMSKAGQELELRVEERTADLAKANLTLHTEVAKHEITEKTLRESEERFSGAFEYAPIGVALVGPDGRWIRVNRAVCDLVGYSEAELYSRTFQDITHPEDLDSDLESMRRLLEGEIATYQMEKRYIHRHGHFVTVLLSVSLVLDDQSQPRYFISQIQDITARKQAEAALTSERDLLRTLLDQSPDKIYFKDAQSRFIKASQTMARQFMVASPEEMAGKTDFDFFTEAHAQPAFEDEQEIIRTGVPMIGKVEQEVWQDGRETWVITTKMPFRDKDGKIIGTFGVSKDITAMKQAEANLAHEQARFQFIFESMPVGVALSRQYPDGRFERIINDAHLRICDLAREQDHGPETYRQITHPDDHARQDELCRQLDHCHQGRFSLDKRYLRPDGEVVWVAYSFQRYHYADGCTEELTTVVDITERKRSEVELEKLHKQLLETSRQAGMAEVATNVLHNVGNVLNSVNISCSVIANRVRGSRVGSVAKAAALLHLHTDNLAAFLTTDPTGRKLPDYLGKLATRLAEEQLEVLKELQLLGKNIDHIKDIVAMQQNHAKISGITESVNASDLMEDGLRMNQESLANNSVRVTREYSEVPPIKVEKHKLLQILVNLIRNANYACEDSGRDDKHLTLRAAAGPDCVRLSVIDNGVGISAENLTRVFAHGFTTKTNGHGFGLHSGALAAREMGGSLTVHSDGPGTGAAFILELPTQPQQD